MARTASCWSCCDALGEGSRTFVEFGATVARTRRSFLRTCSAGPVCTSEGDAARAARLQAKYADTAIEVKSEIVTPDTIDDIFESAGVPAEPDVLSIDVDGPDYWIWSGLQRHRPRILLIEYNASLGTGSALVQPRDRQDDFDRTAYGGASITALRSLGARKGYRLVHTEMTGNNAFFVRDDQPEPTPRPSVFRCARQTIT